MQSARSAIRFAALALLAPAAFPQQVIVVDAASGGDHLDLQAAVDAAAVDDVLLVRTGSYTAPTLGKGLAIVADSGADVEVRGTTMVSGTSAEVGTITSMSTMGFAARPGTAVLPTCSIALAIPTRAGASRVLVFSKTLTHPGSWSLTTIGFTGC